MDTSKKRRKRRTKKRTNYLTIIIICVITSFAGLFMGKLNSSALELSLLEEENIANEATLKTKEAEVAKLKEKLLEKTSSIEDLQKTITELNIQLEELNSIEEIN